MPAGRSPMLQGLQHRRDVAGLTVMYKTPTMAPSAGAATAKCIYTTTTTLVYAPEGLAVKRRLASFKSILKFCK